MLPDHERARRSEDDGLAPPFLLETTEFVRPRVEPSALDGVRRLVDTSRPPYGVLAAIGVAGLLAILYLNRPTPEPEVDPFAASEAPSTIVVSSADSGASGTPTGQRELNDLLATPSPGGVSPTLTVPLPTTETTEAPSTTVAETTAPPSTDPPTTPSTEQPTTAPTEPPIVRLADCWVETRGNTAIFAGPAEDPGPIGRIGREYYLAIAATSNADGNWLFLQDVNAQGWIKRGRVRDFDGDCG
ncbi:MAG: hypothetical protein AAGD35_14835 [Actinomycetota bacterium]